MTNRPPAPRPSLISIALIVSLICLSGYASAVVIDETIDSRIDTSATVKHDPESTSGYKVFDNIVLNKIEKHPYIYYIGVDLLGGSGYPDEGAHDITYTIEGGKTGTGVMHVSYQRNALQQVIGARYTIFFHDWYIGGLTGRKRIDISVPFGSQLQMAGLKYVPTDTVGGIGSYTSYYSDSYRHTGADSFTIVSCINFVNRLIVDKDSLYGYKIDLYRHFDGIYYTSTLDLLKGDTCIHHTYGANDITLYALESEIDAVRIITPANDVYIRGLAGDPGDPGDAILRTGTVTMTDNNGTTIRGFEVTAVNAYTGENYTVSTETDVAVMTLPMDRTIQIRNPQTGVYEEAPIGYYRFYGQASGYKMLNEGGIQVVVMPEKYSTYKFCDIGVTSESGYLTGKHQFQIRSRSDNSILQTGTVSAKSATTGDWYNTTVSGGIATLILPYDTSNVNSQYAGNYYVYATSPGYQDSDYGTQIVVMPQTVSEIRSILLTPIGGIPPAGNVTLRIQVFSETGPGVVDAEIFIAGVSGEGSSVWDTYTASSTGYLTVSVPGNSTYDIVASGAGYYDSARRIEVLTTDPPLIEIKLYLSGAPTLEPTTQPTGWPTDHPTTQPTGGIPDEDDDSEGFLMQAVRGIGLAFGVGFATAKLIFGMLLALSIGYTTAKQLRGGAAEFGLGLLGGTLLGVLIGLLPVWIIVVLLLVVGLYIGNRYVGGGSNNG